MSVRSLLQSFRAPMARFAVARAPALVPSLVPSLALALVLGPGVASAQAAPALCADPGAACAARMTYDCAAAHFGVTSTGQQHGLGRDDFLPVESCEGQMRSVRGCLVHVGRQCEAADPGFAAEAQRFIDGEEGLSDFAAFLLAEGSGEPSYLRAYAETAAAPERGARAAALADQIDADRAAAQRARDNQGWSGGAPYGAWRCDMGERGAYFLVFDRAADEPVENRAFGLRYESDDGALLDYVQAEFTDALSVGLPDRGGAMRGAVINFPNVRTIWRDGTQSLCAFHR